MPLWSLIDPVLRFALANVDFRFLYDRLTATRVRRVPHTRAHVVDALNALFPAARATWTPQSLFLFIAAFAKVEALRTGGMRVEWIREPSTVVTYVLRGVTCANAGPVEAMLHEECGEVFETLVAIAPQARPPNERLESPAAIGPRFYAETLGRLGGQQQSMRDRKIVGLLAGALLHGGLSTNECRHLLLAHDIAARDVDMALRTGEVRK